MEVEYQFLPAVPFITFSQDDIPLFGYGQTLNVIPSSFDCTIFELLHYIFVFEIPSSGHQVPQNLS